MAGIELIGTRFALALDQQKFRIPNRKFQMNPGESDSPEAESQQMFDMQSAI